MTALPAAPGDVLAVVGGGLAGTIIRLGELIAGKTDKAGHVVGITHQDVKGRWVGIQGEPGGVNLVDCTPFLNDSRTRTNHGQPRASNHNQLTTYLASAAKSLGLKYDWVAIDADVASVFSKDLAADIEHLWAWPSDKNLIPGHIVCSSLFAMLYDLPAVGWKHPDLGSERLCEPAGWYAWNDQQLWLKP